VSLKELPLPSIASLRAIAALRSPHLAMVRPARIGLGFESSGTNQKTLLEVEELLGGPGRLSLPYSLRWLLDVLTGLGVLHRTLSFVHGEVQPEHIVLGDDGVGRLVPVVRAHWVRGEERAAQRLYYLAPEKLLGDKVDVRSDVFSVGVMLWEALSGQRLLEATQVDDIIARMMGGGIPRAHVPEAEVWTSPLIDIAERAVAVDPGRRFATVAQLKEALERACLRYLASPPGMAELFQNPEQRARSRSRDSLPPQSQRATVPPIAGAVPRVSTRPGGATIEPPTESSRLDAAAERLARSSFGSDSDDEATTIPPPAPAPTAPPRPSVVTAPTRSLGPPSKPPPVERKGNHVNTLLGVPPPFIPRRTPAGVDQVKAQNASRPPPESNAPTLMVPMQAMNVTVPVGTPAPVVTPRPPREPAPPAQSFPPPRVNAPSMTDWEEAAPGSAAPRLASISPLVAAEAEPDFPLEPTFELAQPRRKRGAIWLALGAALAIGAFAARPWLARQVAAATGTLPDRVTPTADTNEAVAPATPPASETAIGEAPSAEPSPEQPVGIASTPAVPSERPTRFRSGRPEDHVVIDDREQLKAAPAREEKKPAPAAEPPPPPVTPPPTPPPAPKPKPPPVSDADRYGI
jgi:serine/threonine protein kinase